MSTRLPACAAALLLLLSGCKDREIVSYRAPKDPKPAATPPAAGMANTNDLPKDHPEIGPNVGAPMMPTASTPADANATMANTAVPTGSDNLTWTAPTSWTAMPQRPMRKATYAIKGNGGADADLSITSFPGDTGGLLANINRWRGQIALPPLSDAQLGTSVSHVDIGNLHVDVVDFLGTTNGTPTRILGAIVPFQGDTWFFKVTGPDALVAGEKANFMAFLKTIKSR